MYFIIYNLHPPLPNFLLQTNSFLATSRRPRRTSLSTTLAPNCARRLSGRLSVCTRSPSHWFTLEKTTTPRPTWPKWRPRLRATIGTSGTTVLSSNWSLPTRFIYKAATLDRSCSILGLIEVYRFSLQMLPWHLPPLFIRIPPNYLVEQRVTGTPGWPTSRTPTSPTTQRSASSLVMKFTPS